jgi:LysR family hydrogen peroxide-inducible transcriptional activator
MRSGPFPFSLRQAQYALAVLQHRNFHKAAAACHVAQPSLSAQLHAMEEALGVTLFDRSRRQVTPTRAGEEVLLQLSRLLGSAEEVMAASARRADPLAGALTLGVIPTIAPYLLPEVTPRLKKAFPKLTLQWLEEKTGTLVSMLESGEVDGALLALEAALGDVDHHVVGKDPFVLAGAAGHPLFQSRSALRADALEQEEVLLLADGHCFGSQAWSFCQRVGALASGFHATSLATLAQMAASGGGVTLLPRLAVPAENRRGSLQLRSLAAPVPSRTLVVIWRRGSPLETSVKPVGEALEEAYAALVPRLEAAALKH